MLGGVSERHPLRESRFLIGDGRVMLFVMETDANFA